MAYNSYGDSRYTLKDLLEIPELQHPPVLNRHFDSKKTGVSAGYGMPSAFLGPNLWNNASQVGGPENGEFSLQYMDLDEFLSENGIPSSELNNVNTQCAQSPQKPKLAVPPSENYIQLQTPPTPQALSPGLPPKRASPDNSPRQVYEDVHETSASTFYSNEGLQSPSSPYKCAESSNGSSSVSSQNTNHSCSNDHSAQLDIAGQENFDPRKCKFSEEELKPQPIIRKSRKVFVPDACKDERYWMRRTKNNIAAKRSREARRIKENQIALRAAFLEKENNALKDEVNKIKEENVNLQKKLSQYEQGGK